MATRRKLTRRQFLATGAAAGAPLVVAQQSAAGKVPANEKIVIGHIGIGGMGRGHLKFIQSRGDAETGALCDVDQEHLDTAKQIVGRPVEGYADYRRVLDRKDIDAVIIASPDHWHGLMAIHACEAGKDVYVEKPASKTIEEGRAMVDAANRHKRIVQVGSQGRSTPAAHAACNYIRNGQLGAVRQVDCWHYPNPVGGDPAKNTSAPGTLDWDMWLGPAEWVKYNPDRCHFNFRWMLDFGGGQIRDRGAHVLSVVSWCLGLDETGPVKVTAKGTPPAEGLWDCAPDFEVVYEFKDPDLTVAWRQPGPDPVDDKFGAVYRGTSDSLIVYGGDGGVRTEPKATAYTPSSDGYHAFASPGHHQNWFDCIKSREQPIMHIEAGHRVATMCILGNVAYRIGRPVEWDPKEEHIKNDAAAHRLLGTAGRGIWHL